MKERYYKSSDIIARLRSIAEKVAIAAGGNIEPESVPFFLDEIDSYFDSIPGIDIDTEEDKR